jgi:DNA-binding NtrC family response regulator
MHPIEVPDRPDEVYERRHKTTVAQRHPLEPTILILSSDGSLFQLVQRGVPESRHIELCNDTSFAHWRLSNGNIRLVVIDDQTVMPNDRCWLLNQIRHRDPDTFVIYIAAKHSAEREKQARTNGANYYMSKPVDAGRFTQVLRAFVQFGG